MIEIISDKCVKCGDCVKVCPQHVISIGSEAAVIGNYSDCMECGACRLNCRYNAIDLTKGTGCMVAIIKEDILNITPKNSGCGCGSNNSSSCC